MLNFKSHLVALSSIILLSGCEAVFTTKNYTKSLSHEEVVFFYTSTNYPKQLQDNTNKKLRQRTLVFGPYMPNIGGGGGAFGGNYNPYKGPMKNEEIVALWRMPTEEKTHYYYVRSEPNRGVIRADRDGHNAYHVGVALGPMRVLKGGLTAKQFEESSISGYDYYGDPVYYRWGELNTLYYITGIFTARELQTEHHLFHEIKGIAITAKQYDKLYERCHSDWVAVKCFMDESFPDLTAEQLAYIQSRKHPDYDDRLAGKFPKPEPDVNHFK
jgi:hypothetical protein